MLLSPSLVLLVLGLLTTGEAAPVAAPAPTSAVGGRVAESRSGAVQADPSGAWSASTAGADSPSAGSRLGPEGTRDSSGWAPASDDPEFVPRVGESPDSGAALQALALPESLGAERPVDYLWVVRTALTSSASVDSVVVRARAMGVRGLLVQVVGRGDAYYRSDLLPRAEALGSTRLAGFDPLGELIARAHPAGLEVHAWMNCMLVWSGARRPRDPRHVVNMHPEWIARLRDGRPMTSLSERERQRLRIEGVYLSPAHPRVRNWIARIATEIATRYPVDGIHLDYIRQPDVAVGFDPTTRARFAMETHIDPARMRAIDPSQRAHVDSAWAEFQRAQVTAVVREVRDSLRARRPEISLSAAVVADTARAERSTAQAWRRWLKDRLIDRAYLMCYAQSVQVVMGQLVGLTEEFGIGDRVVPGIAVYNTSAGTAAIKIKGARALGFPLVALYSYDSLFERVPGWSGLLERLGP